jgi:hypothetical protein
MTVVKLGKQPYRHDDRTLQLARYVDPGRLPVKPLDLTASVTDWGMLGNDEVGDCGPAAWEHLRMARSAIDAGQPVQVTTQDTLELYRRISGWNGRPGDPSDQGVVLLDMLNQLRHDGAIYAFAQINPKDHRMLAAAHYLFGGVLYGFDLPLYIQPREDGRIPPWRLKAHGRDDAQPGSWGGHAVCSARLPGHRVVSWGQVIPCSLGFVDHYTDEAWALISPEWFGTDQRTPAGLDLASLEADLSRI